MQLYIREQNKTEVQLTKNNDDNDDDCDQVKLINWTAGVQMKRWAIGLIETDDEWGKMWNTWGQILSEIAEEN